jgi:hypothetical protein
LLGRLNSKKRVSFRINQLRKTLHVDTQRTRSKLITNLEEIFEIATNYARGRIKRVTDENGKERQLTIVERQFWARIAAFTAQTINSIAKGIDERQIDLDLNKLEAMLNKTAAADKAEAVDREPPGKSEGA